MDYRAAIFSLLLSFIGFQLETGVAAQSCNLAVNETLCAARSSYALLSANQTTADYLYLGGVFGVHEPDVSTLGCGQLIPRRLQQLEAFMWAVQTFQERYRDGNKLADLSLGAIGFDTCELSSKAIQQLLNFINCEQAFGSGEPIQPDHVTSFIGPSTVPEAGDIGHLLSAIERTVISPEASAAALTEGGEAPYFLRTVPSDRMQIDAISEILADMNWEFIQIVYSQREYGSQLYQLLTSTLPQDTCAVNTVMLPMNAISDDYISAMTSLQQHPETRVVVLLLSTDETKFLLQAAQRNRATNFTWIAGTEWGTNDDVTDRSELVSEGAITLDYGYGTMPAVDDFKDYFGTITGEDVMRNPWFVEFENLRLPFVLDAHIAYVIQAVDSALLGIHEALTDSCNGEARMCDAFMNDENRWQSIHNKIRTLNQDLVAFNANTGDQTAGVLRVYRYTAPNAGNSGYYYKELGTYQRSLLLLQNADSIPPTASGCSATPCSVCGETTSAAMVTESATNTATVPMPQPASSRRRDDPPSRTRDDAWVVVLIVCAAVGMLLVLVFEIVIICKLSGSSMPWRKLWLGQLLLLAIFLSYLCLFAFVPSANDTTCGIIRFSIGSCYAMIFSVLLVKLMIILSSKTIGYLKGIFQVLMFVFAFGVQLAIDLEWLLLRHPEAEYSHMDGSDEIWACAQSFDNHVTTLAYVMFLILVCTLLAAKANGIVTNHRESVYILAACCLVICVFLVWILVGILVDDAEDYEDPCLAFGLLATATIVLLVLFVPKLVQLCTTDVTNVWSDDDSRDYAASIIAPTLTPDMLIGGHSKLALVDTNHASHNSQPIVVMDDVDLGMYSDPIEARPQPSYTTEALHLRHPSNDVYSYAYDTRSLPMRRARSATMMSAPVRAARLVHVPRNHDRGYPVYERRAQSEVGFPTAYGTARSVRSAGSMGRAAGHRRYYTLQKPQSLVDLGSL